MSSFYIKSAFISTSISDPKMRCFTQKNRYANIKSRRKNQRLPAGKGVYRPKMNQRYEKVLARIALVILILSLLPIMYLGRYNHPTGDDYYYGVTTYHERLEGGNVFQILAKAAHGVSLEYRQWQGTYSAMFFMYLPPNIWGVWAYRMVTTVMLLSLTGSIFYCLKPLICVIGKCTTHMWIAVSSVAALLCVETVPSQGETFFWYNGSMYYTGFFSISLVFLGLLLRELSEQKKHRFVLLLLLSVLLSGGNYVSLLPLMILTISLAVYLLAVKKRMSALELGVICIALIGAFAVNALAPGNAVRQSGMWKIPAWKAVLKSLLQGIIYLRFWIRPWWLAAVLCLTPIFLRSYRNSALQFRFPLIVAAFSYGVFCSMSCPLFYTMNSTGPARAVSIVYYGFILCTLFIYYYLLGALYRLICAKGLPDKMSKICHASGIIVFALLIILQTANGTVLRCTTAKAVTLLVNGEAKAYEAEYQKRMLVLKNPAITKVEFAPYKHQPDMLYVGDFSSDSEDPTNRKTAEYFKKESIVILYE